MTKLGITIYNAIKRSYPVLRDGSSRLNPKQKLSLTNPYLLEALPENSLNSLNWIEGKKLSTVTRILDSSDYSAIISRYNAYCNKFKGFNDIELQSLYKKAFGGGKVPNDINLDAFVFLHNLNPKKAALFDAHGIAKISVPDQLKQLNELLTKGIDKNRNFYTAPLAVDCPSGVGAGLGTAGGHAVRDGSFILVSGKSKKLASDGIETVIVNDAYYSIIDDLSQKFPNIKFIRADKAADYFNKL